MTILPQQRLCLAVLFTAWSFVSPSIAADGFENVRCDRSIKSALIGTRRSIMEPVVRIEARRKSIGLKQLGADEIANGVNVIDWVICGHTFVLLDVRGVSRDVIEVPTSSRETPAFSASSCDVSGQRMDGVFLGVFATPATREALTLPAKAVWRVDTERNRFVPLPTPASCGTEGIYTPDAPN